MADSITSSRNLNVTLSWKDPIDTDTTKTATIKIPNYLASSATEATIKEKFNTVLNMGFFRESTNGEVLTSDALLTAATTDQTINVLDDIGWED